MKLKNILNLSILSISPLVFAEETTKYTPYILKKGETVSEIVHKYKLAPLYGEKEWVSTVLKLNRLNYESTKKLDPGDVVILPVARNLLSADRIDKNYIKRDEVKTLYSSWRTTETLKALKDSKHNFKAGLGYKHKSVSVKGRNFDIQQTFAANLSYWQNIDVSTIWAMQPVVSGSVAKSSDSSLTNTQNISATFSPDYELEGGLKLINKNWEVRFIPSVSYASESYIEGGEFFGISEIKSFWIKGSIEKSWSFSSYKLTPGLTFSKSTTEESFDALKTKGYVDFLMSNNFSLQADVEQTVADSNFGDITTASMGLGYRF